MLAELIAALRNNARRAYKVFISKMFADGSYPVKEDLAAYYKHPMMYLSLGDRDRANVVLDHIVLRYFREDGDFLTEKKRIVKSENPAYQEFYAYINGWIVRAANKLDREDISDSGLTYLTSFQDLKTSGFYTHNPGTKDGVTDVITTAHLGLGHLEAGRINVAIAAGNYLYETLAKQPNLEFGFYLRRDASGDCIVTFSDEIAPSYIVKKSEPEQLYFMIAYPIAHLIELYKKTKKLKYLETAKEYTKFVLSCHESVLACEFSHKLAWALSKLYKLAPEPIYLHAIQKITEYFLLLQDEDGLWFSKDALKCYDQSAEIVCWFMEIARNLEPKKI